jgi:hypothetical protein
VAIRNGAGTEKVEVAAVNETDELQAR